MDFARALRRPRVARDLRLAHRAVVGLELGVGEAAECYVDVARRADNALVEPDLPPFCTVVVSECKWVVSE